MRTEVLVEHLSRNLHPVRPRSLVRDAILLLVLAAIEIAAFLSLGFMRPDMPTAMDAPSFWWKLASMGIIAVFGAAIALLSVDPARSPRPGLRFMLLCVIAIFISGWAIDASHGGIAHLLARLDWRHGLQCVWKMVALSIPPALALCLLGRRGAPTDRSGTAWAAALSAAAWGAFVFVFACPSDDPLYIAVWYTLGCAIVTITARTVMLRLWRW